MYLFGVVVVGGVPHPYAPMLHAITHAHAFPNYCHKIKLDQTDSPKRLAPMDIIKS